MTEYVRMDAEHITQVAELGKICFHDPWSLKSITAELTNPLSLWLVALHGGIVIGYVGSQTVLGEADMMNLAVAPDFRRMGVARELVTRLIEQLHSSGAYSLTLEVRQSNAPAIALYHELGFVQVGKRPNYYYNPKEDALILKKEWEI